MATAGATNYGFLPLYTAYGPTAYSCDVFFLPVPDSVIELCNANPSLCIPYLSGIPSPGSANGCQLLWSTGIYPGIYPAGSSVLVMIPSAAVGGCGGEGNYRESW